MLHEEQFFGGCIFGPVKHYNVGEERPCRIDHSLWLFRETKKKDLSHADLDNPQDLNNKLQRVIVDTIT